MSWWRFWNRDSAKTEHATPHTADRDAPIPRPAAFSKAAMDPETRQRRITTLHRRRDGVLYDLDQGELAKQPENPWRERIDLLTESIRTVEDDLAALDARKPLLSINVPTTPITSIAVTPGDHMEVNFTVGDEPFHFVEAVDWDNRGGIVVRGDLRPMRGDVSRLVPPHIDPSRRDDLLAHLANSLAVFAVDLRDRSLDENPLPPSPTLADLAQPCPTCGGWQDWRGRCVVCAERAYERQGLRAEAARLERERAQEAEQQRTLIDRIPIARKRLTDIEAELARLGGD